MPLPLITSNMYFDTVLKAIETTLKAEAENQVTLLGTGWQTVRERFDPWNVDVDEFNPGVVNVVWSNSGFPDAENNSEEQASNSEFDLDCYASEIALVSAGVITPGDQRSADVLHTLISKVYYTISSPIYYDLGLTAGTIVRPIITRMVKFIPSEINVAVEGVIAARLSCRIKHEELPPQETGVNLEIINVDADQTTGGVGGTDQTFDLTT